MSEINYWLMKSEPEAYSINQLQIEETTLWDGIRNYQARNFMRAMNIGDIAFFYHSNCKPPGIVGLMEVIDTHLVDPTQFDPKSNYYDQKSIQEKPRWDCTKMKYLGKFNHGITLEELKATYNESELQVVRRGNRLSIMPVAFNTAKDILTRLGEAI